MSYTIWLDESYTSRSDLFVFGGFSCLTPDLGTISDSWCFLKSSLGLDSEDELKYTLGKGHPSRKTLDSTGKTHRVRVPMMLNRISEMPITIVATTVDEWRRANDKRPTDQYPMAFRWVVRGFAQGIDESDVSSIGPHFVIVDSPPDLGKLDRAAISMRMRSHFKDRGKYAFNVYKDMYEHPQRFTSSSPGPSLKRMNFLPGLLSSHGKYSDFLQIADVIVGVVREYVSYMKSEDEDSLVWQEENMRRLLPKFRRSDWDIVGFGYFPHSNTVKRRILDLVDAYECEEPF